MGEESRRSKNYKSGVQPKRNNKRSILDKKYKFSKLRVYLFAVAFMIFYKK